jgi:hypothetical protein
MKTKTKEKIKFNFQSSLHGKRDYYFHADEDFREDREWGKTKSNTVKASTFEVRAGMDL